MALETSSTPLLMGINGTTAISPPTDHQTLLKQSCRRPTISEVNYLIPPRKIPINYSCITEILKKFIIYFQVVDEIKNLYSIAFPLIITGLLVYGKSVISIVFMGKLGKEALAGGSLGNGVANIAGYSIISGLAMGMEGISSQACGAKQWSLMSQILQRTILILLFTSLPISLLWLHIEPILIFFGQDPIISSTASSYLAFCLPDLFFQSFINPLKIHLRTQNITFPLMLGSGFALVLHGPITYFLIYRTGLGIGGIAVAAAVTDFVLLITLILYMLFSGVYKRSWQGFSYECFQEWRPILGLAIPSCVSVCLEWWWYELMILLSGLLSNAAEVVATMGIVLQVCTQFLFLSIILVFRRYNLVFPQFLIKLAAIDFQYIILELLI